MSYSFASETRLARPDAGGFGNLPRMLRRSVLPVLAIVSLAACADSVADDGSRTSTYGYEVDTAPSDFVTESGAVIRCVDGVTDDGEKFCFEVVNGDAIIEGDISLGRAPAPGGHFEFTDALEVPLGSVAPRSLALKPKSGGILGMFQKNLRWSSNEVPYEIGASVTPSMQKAIETAVASYAKSTTLHFVPRSGQSDYITFEQTTNACNSRVGKTGGSQTINFSAVSCLLHEMGHAVGLVHEQNRPDRDKYVKVYVDRVESGFEGNFRIASNVDTYGAYDFDSMMHYGAFFFAKGSPRLPTITKLDGSTTGFGQRTGFSPGDITTLAAMYP